MGITVAVAGASGYAGGELLRILADHPDFSVRHATAHSQAGKPLAGVHPHLARLDLTLDDPDYNLGFLGFGMPDEYPPERLKTGTQELATFLKRNGKWQVIAWHATALPKTNEPAK